MWLATAAGEADGLKATAHACFTGAEKLACDGRLPLAIGDGG